MHILQINHKDTNKMMAQSGFLKRKMVFFKQKQHIVQKFQFERGL
jgi:hypothetical protein